VVATLSDLHSIGLLQFQASNPVWAFHRHASELALRARHWRHCVRHPDRRLALHLQPEQLRRLPQAVQER
jgi:hypothetical protein